MVRLMSGFHMGELIYSHRYHTNPKFLLYPSKHVSIRGIQEDMYTIVDVTNTAQPKILEEIEVSRLMFDAFEGAVVCPMFFR